MLWLNFRLTFHRKKYSYLKNQFILHKFYKNINMGESNLVVWPKVVLFGDSLTQQSFEHENGFWGALLADRLQRCADVVCRGFGGYNTVMCRKIFPRLFSDKNVSDIAAFIICLGANDSACESKTTNQHVPVDKFTDNLIFMVNYLKDAGLAEDKILLMTPPPQDCKTFMEFVEEYSKQLGREDVPLRNSEIVPEYAKAVHAAANTCNVDVIDLNAQMSKDEDWKKYLVDGLHFNSAGANKVFKTVWPHIAKRVDADNMLMPQWSDFAKELREAEERE